ncbi:MAG: DUF2752 domain-containing protein [Chloroflexi bacterium]|nr:MAG: DUF2752 domain-containing protein [Chloroflexota bacterium]TMF26785.1 MAG: DUF2752 domain-containing protein [Chloroflexota bacterium]TMF95184.1 MAG: DUF2752 domain-containing protein [Chloroflexota bacterium]
MSFAPVPIAVSKAMPGERWRDLGLFAVLAGWLLYTRIYWALQAAHLSAPPCPFFYLTGHPCPFCGGTRSFAYMWQGDLADSVRLYPLGPALFLGTVLGAGGLVGGAITGRTFTPRLTPLQWRLVWIGGISAVLLSWALKVFVLGN